MRTLNRQRGVSVPALIALLIIIGFVITIGIRLTPVYINYYSLVSLVKSVQEDEELRKQPTVDIREAVNKRMRLNEVDKLGYDVVSIKRPSGELVLEIDYEVRRPFVGNIDLIVSFNRRVGP